VIVLDTNVISEMMKDVPDTDVNRWSRSVPLTDMWITSTTVAEVFFGVERLPDGKRKRALIDSAESWVSVAFENRVLAFGEREARLYAALVVRLLRTGRHIDMPDAQIAAIALAHGATLATRNVRDFESTGIAVINPWDAPAS
jgi:predicted nucleic acid-binding protein